MCTYRNRALQGELMRGHSIKIVALLGLCLGAGKTMLAQQAPATEQRAVHIVVTAEPKHGTEVPPVNRDDVMVYEGHDRDRVTEWIPAQGDHAALELFILIDDESTASLGSQLEDIRTFINAQPTSSQVGVAYMQDGIARIVQNLTADHALAAKSLRLPMGSAGVNGSPYFAVSDLVKRWPAGTARRQVLMISDGIDRFYGSGDPDDPYVNRPRIARFAPAFKSPRFICQAPDISRTATGNPTGDKFTFRRLPTRREANRITSDSPDHRFPSRRISRI